MINRYALDDCFLRDRLKQIIDEYNIKMVVETGTNEGLSTVAFCQLAPKVIGIEDNPAAVFKTKTALNYAGVSNFELIQGDSPIVLKSIMPTLSADQTLFFLDAHWGPIWPLPEEIRSLPKGKGIIVVHDIQIPGTDFGFDGVPYNGEVCDFTYELIKDILDEWSPTHRIEYMMEGDPSSSYRGVAIFYPS